MTTNDHRRQFLTTTVAFGLAAAASSSGPLHAEDDVKDDKEAPISAPEDLMREHGLLNRILLIYQEALQRLRRNEEVPPEAFQQPAQLVRKFVEDYHEKLEEKFVFPQFETHKKLLDLVAVLRRQHEAGRKLTDGILRHAVPDQFGKPEVQQDIVRGCEAFIRMYRPHEAREDTVLFPALYEIVTAEEVKELGEQFEEEEHRLFGEDGFHKTVEKVAAIEKQLGIYDLASFTPK